MEKMWTLVKKLVKEEEGLETVEYAVVGGLVILVGVLVWRLLGQNVSEKIQSLADVVGS
jgi:Flp pilus assembly pilin Flp